MTTRDTERLEDELLVAQRTADELASAAAHIRKFHPHEPAYVDLANGLEDLISDFRGSFAHIRQELSEAEQSSAHAEMMAQGREYFSTQL